MRTYGGYWFAGGVTFLAAVVVAVGFFFKSFQNREPTTVRQSATSVTTGGQEPTTAGGIHSEFKTAGEETSGYLHPGRYGHFDSGLPISSSLELADPIPGIEAELDDWLQGPLGNSGTDYELH
jgi:hypothetical protein